MYKNISQSAYEIREEIDEYLDIFLPRDFTDQSSTQISNEQSAVRFGYSIIIFTHYPNLKSKPDIIQPVHSKLTAIQID